MPLIDFILLVFLGGFIVLGFMTGLFQTLGSLFGLVFGYYLASRYYEGIGSWLTPLFMGREAVANLIGFVIVFLITTHMVGIVFWFLARAFQVLKHVPLYALMNRFGGAVLGFVEGLFVIGIVLLVADQFLHQPNLADQLSRSDLAQLMLGAANLLGFILPESFRVLPGLF